MVCLFLSLIQHHKEPRHHYAWTENYPDMLYTTTPLEAPAVTWMCQWPIHGVMMLFVKQLKSKEEDKEQKNNVNRRELHKSNSFSVRTLDSGVRSSLAPDGRWEAIPPVETRPTPTQGLGRRHTTKRTTRLRRT